MARKVKESEEAVDDAYIMPTSMTVFVQGFEWFLVCQKPRCGPGGPKEVGEVGRRVLGLC